MNEKPFKPIYTQKQIEKLAAQADTERDAEAIRAIGLQLSAVCYKNVDLIAANTKLRAYLEAYRDLLEDLVYGGDND